MIRASEPLPSSITHMTCMACDVAFLLEPTPGGEANEYRMAGHECRLEWRDDLSVAVCPDNQAGKKMGQRFTVKL
jgi:hypothetical protein